MQNLTPYVITAPGFYGVNTQDSPTDLESGYALSAINCIIDQYGRIGSRKGWEKVNTSTGTLGSNDVQTIGEHIANDGTSTVIIAGNSKLFKLDTTLTELTYGGGGVAPTITGNKWSCVSLDGYFLLFQSGHDPLAYVPTVSTTQYRRLSEVAGYSGTVQLADVAINAFGRVWNACTTTDKVTIQFSDTKSPHKYSGGTSGTLDLTSVWPSGGDSIVGLGAHNNRLFIFGKQHILIYKDASTPASMSLDDAISGIGCVSHNTIAETGTDIIFLSQTGVRSVQRTIQEKSAPLRDISKNVRTDLLTEMAGETLTNIFGEWNQKEGFYLLHLPTIEKTYCFDFKQALPDGSSRVTTWDNISPTALFSKLDGTLLIGKTGYVGTHSGYYDDTSSYRFQYYTPYVDFGSPNAISMIKKVNVIVIGGSNQTVVTKWSYDYTQNFKSQQGTTIVNALAGQFNTGEFNINEFSNGIVLNTLSVNAAGSGKVAQVGFESDIAGNALSIQKMEVYAKNGKLR